MLNFLIGAERRTVTKELLNIIAESAKKKERSILVVPEQYSYDAERLLCGRLGFCSSLTAESLSFSRLADRAASLVGKSGTPSLDDGGKYVICLNALELALPRLKFFASSLNRPELVMGLVRQIEEFKRFGVTFQKLRDLSLSFDGVFAEKLEELSFIYESYDYISVSGDFDPSDKLSGLPEQIWENELFSHVNFYFDGFTDFTVPQMRVIEVLMQMGCQMTFSFVYLPELASASAFSAAEQTIGKLKSLAKRFGVQESLLRIPEEKSSVSLAKWMVAGVKCGDFSRERLSFYQLPSIYEECRRAAEEVKKQIMSGCHYRDITVAAADPNAYIFCLKPLFERQGIPTTWNESFPMSAEPLILALLSGIRAASNHYAKEDVIRFLKSPLSPLSGEEADILENYANTWNIDYGGWEKTFDMSPEGYQKSKREGIDAETVNGFRLRLMEPLAELREGLLNAKSCAEMTKCVYHFISGLQIEEKLEEICGKPGILPSRAGLLAQIPGVLASALEQLYSQTENYYKSPEEYCRILKNLLSVYSLKTIPATLDAVTFGSFEAVKYKSSRCLILLGCEEGSFPSYSSEHGILSDHERELLCHASEEPVCSDAISGLNRKMASVYELLCNGWDRTAFLWQGKSPSYILSKILPEAFDPDSFAETAELIYDPSGAAAKLAVCEESDGQKLPDFIRELAENLKGRAEFQPGNLLPEEVNILYGKILALSASKADTFSACRLAYFLKYGLALREEKTAEIDASIFGTMTHEVLERTVRRLSEEKQMKTAAPELVREICEGAISDFLSANVPMLAESDIRFRQQMEMNREEICRIAWDVVEEFRVSDYAPRSFELSFGEGELSQIRIRGKLGLAVMGGKVDRVDVFRSGDEGYLKIADYKTGHKEFKYSDLWEGMGMQMLIYLFALKNAKDYSALRPAGVLYIPASSGLQNFSDAPTEKEIKSKTIKAKKRSGLVLNDDLSLDAMEKTEGDFVYLPVKRKSGGYEGNLASASEMQLLKKLVEGNLQKMTDEILGGSVEANPWKRGPEESACRFCPFQSACDSRCRKDVYRTLKEMNNAEFFERLRKEYED